MIAKVAFYVELPLGNLDAQTVKKIKSDLTSVSRDYMTDERVQVEYYHINQKDNTIQVPRFYPVPSYDIKYENITVEGDNLSDGYKLNDAFEYRDGQDISVNDALSSDIITLMKPPGSGKTIIGSAVIFERAVRSIIIVDQDNLKQQWLAALKLVFCDTIKVAPDMKFNGKDYGFDVYVTTIQSIIAKIRISGLEHVREEYSKYNVGQVILDECHVLIGPEKFSLFGHVCNSKYILALSATPKSDIYFKYWLGELVVGDNIYEVTPNVVQLVFNTNLGKSKRWINWANKFRKDRYSQKVFEQLTYLDFVCAMTYKAYLKRRNVLVICDYNKHGVDTVVEHLKKYVDENLVGTYVGGCDKEVMGSRPIIVSNYKMLQKGTDIPTLDTLIMADSVGNVTALEQTIGRLLRLNKGVKKKELIVIDIHDCDYGDIFLRRKKIRDDFYIEKAFNVI